MQVSQVYKTMLKWSHFNYICTKMFCGIFKSLMPFEVIQKYWKLIEKQFLPLGVVEFKLSSLAQQNQMSKGQIWKIKLIIPRRTTRRRLTSSWPSGGRQKCTFCFSPFKCLIALLPNYKVLILQPIQRSSFHIF